MTVNVVTALHAAIEADTAAALESAPSVTVVRRCSDVADLVAVAASGRADVALVSPSWRGLTADVVGRLRAGKVSVIGIVDEAGQDQLLRRLGVGWLIAADASPAQLVDACVSVCESESAQREQSGGQVVPQPQAERPPERGRQQPVLQPQSDPKTQAEPKAHSAPKAEPDPKTQPEPKAHSAPTTQSQPTLQMTARSGHTVSHEAGHTPSLDGRPASHPHDPVSATSAPPRDGVPAGIVADIPAETGTPGRGTLVAVWGPIGAPGRTTIAISLASLWAQRGQQVLLIDGDTWGPSVAQALAVVDEAPGVLAAAREADRGRLDPWSLAALAPTFSPGLRVLTGLPAAHRWPELRETPWEAVLEHARSLADIVIVDCGFCLEDDEELSYDTAAPRRNATTLATLSQADAVLAVAAGDPVGLQRITRGLQDLSEIVASDVAVIINKVRSTAVGGQARQQIEYAMTRFTGRAPTAYLPFDIASCDAAALAGVPVVEHAPKSAMSKALGSLAAQLLGEVLPARAIARLSR